MLQLRCDACDKPFEVSDQLLNQKVACPACGDVQFARSRPAAPEVGRPVTDRAASAGLPPAAGPEEIVKEVKPAMFRARPISFILVSIGLLGGIIGAIVTAASGLIPVAAICAVVAIAAGVVMLFWKIHCMSAGLTITTKRSTERVGLFSKATTEILHRDIRNFTVTQTFWQRLWNVGTIGISSAAEDETEIVMNDVPRPAEVHKAIDVYRKL